MRVRTTIIFDENEIAHAEKFVRHIEGKLDLNMSDVQIKKLQSGHFESDKIIKFTAVAAEAYRRFLETCFDLGFHLFAEFSVLKTYALTFTTPGAIEETDLLLHPVADSKHVA